MKSTRTVGFALILLAIAGSASAEVLTVNIRDTP